MRDRLERDLELVPRVVRVEICRARVGIETASGTFPCGVSCPASSSRTLFWLRAESRFASTDPAEPPPTMMVSKIMD